MPRCADAICGRWRPDGVVPGVSVGFRLNGAFYCSRNCLEHAVDRTLERRSANAEPSVPPLRLGILLRHLGIITRQQLDLALHEQRWTGLRLGAQLRALGLVDAESIVRALAAQADMPYLTALDLNRVRRSSPLSIATVQALGLVPFAYDERAGRISVITQAPAPRAALRALATLTGLAVEPYVVDDELFETALAAYEPDVTLARPAPPVVVGRGAAATEFAATVAATRGATLKQARCDGYTWVRIEGTDNASDVLVAEKEAA
jgi:hypothetical protein